MSESIDWAAAAREQIDELRDRDEELSDRLSALRSELEEAETALGEAERHASLLEERARNPETSDARGYAPQKAKQVAAQLLGEHMVALAELRESTRQTRERLTAECVELEREKGDLVLEIQKLKPTIAIGEFRNAFFAYEHALTAANAWKLADRVRNTGKAIGLTLDEHPALVNPDRERQVGPYYMTAQK